jgi:hypothetical protein
VRLVGVRRPRTVTVAGRRTAAWTYDATRRTLVVGTGSRPLRRATRIVAR